MCQDEIGVEVGSSNQLNIIIANLNRKHDLRHKKPFHCPHSGCSRKEGFSTSNDLDRHTRSKHPTDRTSSKVYRCAYPKCKSYTKCWPRLDNFRCHIKRVHQMDGDVLEDLVRK